MGTTADKGAYLKDTKSLLKQKINNLGGDITDETTFRQYAEELQNVYDILPKTAYAEGSNITLSNCLKGKLDYEDGKVGYGDTLQESTTGRNLLPSSVTKTETSRGVTFSTDGKGKYIISGKLTSENNTYVDFPINKIFTSGTYYWHLRNTGTITSTINIAIRSSNSTITYLSLNVANRISSFTLAEATTIDNIRLTIGGAYGTNSIDIVLEPSIETTSNETEYEKYTGGISAPNPSYPQPIQVVTGEQEVVVRGKNLFDDINFVYGFVNSSGVISITTTSKINAMSDYIPCLPNTSYVASSSEQIYGIGIAEFDENKTYIKRYSRQNVSTSAITTTNETKYLIVWYNYDNTTNMTTQLIKNKEIQFEQSDQATTYEPYITPITKQLSLGNIELCKIGTYRDYIYKNNGKWYKLGKIKKLTMNGNEEGWQYSNSTLINTKIEDYFKTTDNVLTCYLNYYKSVAQVSSANNLTNNYIATFGNNASNYRLYIKDNNFSTINPYKEWLSTHNLIVYYVLATPTDTEITDTTLVTQLEESIMSNNGTTIIEVNGNLPMIMKVRTLKGE